MKDNPRRAQLETWLAEHATPVDDVGAFKVYEILSRAQPFTFVDAAGYVARFASERD